MLQGEEKEENGEVLGATVGAPIWDGSADRCTALPIRCTTAPFWCLAVYGNLGSARSRAGVLRVNVRLRILGHAIRGAQDSLSCPKCYNSEILCE